MSGLQKRLSRVLLAFAVLAALPAYANAQEFTTQAFPDIEQVDPNGVDVITGTFVWTSPAIMVGTKESGLSVSREIRGAASYDSLIGTILPTAGYRGMMVSFGSIRDAFTYPATSPIGAPPTGPFTPVTPRGQSLTYNSSTYQYTYTDPDGTVLVFDAGGYAFGTPTGPGILSATYPSGLQLNFYYNTTQTTDGGPGRRLYSVVSNAGWHIKFGYASPTPISLMSDAPAWSHVVGVTAVNNLADPCPTDTNTCPVGYGKYPMYSVGSYGTNPPYYCDPLNRCTYFTFGGFGKQIIGIRYPGSSTDNITIQYDANGVVSQVTKNGVVTTYSLSSSNNIATMTATTNGTTRTYVSDSIQQRVLSVTDELGRKTSYQWDSANRLTQVTFPEGNQVSPPQGNYVTYGYDSRSNLTTVTKVAKSGSGLANIVTSATYPSSCTGNLACNKPLTTTDARGNVTNYAYEAHGFLQSVTSPAPTTGAVQPQTRYTYQQYDPTTGAVVSSGGILKVYQTSTCQTTSSCSGTADEVLKTITYGRNLLPISVTEGTGDTSLRATTATTYDDIGNAVAIDGPLSGTADTTHYRYDFDRQLVGEISPDPDGAGPMKLRASRYTYDNTGPVNKIEKGTVASLSDSDWTAMTVLQVTNRNFDPNGRLVYQQLADGSGRQLALTEYSYDNFGRPDCTAQRMNLSLTPGAVGACSLSPQGSFGPDRISETLYDQAGQVTQSVDGVGSSDPIAERTLTYTTNGKLQSLKDANGNLTKYAYDGFDRLWKTTYPDATIDTNSTYDANGNVTKVTNRAGEVTNFTFDALNRVTFKDLPGIASDVTYAYDNLGRLTSASQTGTTLSFTYDALGRNLTQVGPLGTVSSSWDLAGRRTMLTYPDTGLYVNYDYLLTGEVQKIRENGATTGVGVLASYAYDDLGNRTSVTYGNGVTTSYTYDALSRLTKLTNDLYGTANDLTIGTITYNPDSQIVSLPRSNSAYAFPQIQQVGTVNRNYTTNNLNQYTAAGPATLGYDAKGNVTSSVSSTANSSFTYDAENRMISANSGAGTATLSYDPQGRLMQVSLGTSTTKMGYDGTDRIGEYNSAGTLQRRYVFGPAGDEPIVWYEGSKVVSTTRRFLAADERGSVVSVTNSTGALVSSIQHSGINTYDEYGIPASGNLGNWGYTGQAWVPELGMYYYKARFYSPTLGRFMQTDPIGYADNPNGYAYVHNDPVNGTDPTGLQEDGGSDNSGDTQTIDAPCVGASDECTPSDSSQINGRNDATAAPPPIVVTANAIDYGGWAGISFANYGWNIDSGSDDGRLRGLFWNAGYGQTPSRLFIAGSKRINSYQTGYYYQLLDANGKPLTGNRYSLREHIWYNGDGSGNVNSDGTFVPMQNGVAFDIVGLVNPPTPGDNAYIVRYQTFTVLYDGQYYNLTTEFQHTTVIQNGVVTSNVVTDVVP